jgi:hypothetical protein
MCIALARTINLPCIQEGKKKVVDVMPNFSAGGPKRPPTPQYCPPWDEKGTILLLHPSAYYPRYAIEVVQSYGAKTEIRTSMHT